MMGTTTLWVLWLNILGCNNPSLADVSEKNMLGEG